MTLTCCVLPLIKNHSLSFAASRNFSLSSVNRIKNSSLCFRTVKKNLFPLKATFSEFDDYSAQTSLTSFLNTET